MVDDWLVGWIAGVGSPVCICERASVFFCCRVAGFSLAAGWLLVRAISRRLEEFGGCRLLVAGIGVVIVVCVCYW